MINLEIRLIRNNRCETFHHTVSDTSTTSLEAVVDHFDAQVGTVLAVYKKDDHTPIYRAIVDAWDLGADV